MKKIFLILSATLLFTITNNAQETHFGVKAGANFASLDTDPGDNFDSRLGLNIGGLAHIHLSPRFALQPELVYSMQGGKRDGSVGKLNYINLPVLAQVMFGNGFRFQTGPQLGFLVSAKLEQPEDHEIDIKDSYETIDLGWVVGISYMCPQGLGGDIRYNHGLTDITESDLLDQKNRVFQVGLFYQFMHNNKAKAK